MDTCDACLANIPWKIYKSHLSIGGTLETFKLDDVKKTLKKVVTTAYDQCILNMSLEDRAFEFRNYCEKCWRRESSKWNDADYSTVRAKTNANGCYFNVEYGPAFAPNGSPGRQPILSCVCHELMHFWSYKSVGLQDLETRSNVNWDEVITDVLGYLTYKDYYKGKFNRYITPYSDAPKFIDRCGNEFCWKVGFRWNQWLKGKDLNALPEKLRPGFYRTANAQGAPATAFSVVPVGGGPPPPPPLPGGLGGAAPPPPPPLSGLGPLRGTANQQVEDPQLKGERKKLLQSLIFESFVTWYFRGIATPITSLRPITTCDGFLIIFPELINTSSVWSGNRGKDEEHEI